MLSELVTWCDGAIRKMAHGILAIGFGAPSTDNGSGQLQLSQERDGDGAAALQTPFG